MIIRNKKEIIKRIKQPGEIYVYSVLDCEFQVRKKDAIEYVENNPCMLVIRDDGSKGLESIS